MNDFSADETVQKPKLTGFVVLMIVALALGGYALFAGRDGHAPLTGPLDDWINWARIDMTDAGILLVAVIVLAIALIGMVVAMATGGRPKPERNYSRHAFSDPYDASSAALADNAAPAEPVTPLTPRGGSLKFEAPAAGNFVATSLPESVIDEAHGVASLEPAVFHDNASDSFLSQSAVPLTEGFEPNAALSDTHGLHVKAGADVIPIRPDVNNPALEATTGHDPVEAALLAETPPVSQTAPQSDMNAVISSAMSFIGHAEPEAPAVPVTPEPVASATPAPVDDQAEIRQAVQTALSVWPDSTRAIAADEVGGRIAHLYYSRVPEDSHVFHLIAQGELNGAAAALQNRADGLAAAGKTAEAAELWRVYGALHMGRDDPKAMMAYEHVSALDLSDANIHLYLARRYAMANDTVRQPAVLSRALAVISDPATRTELLTPYADLKLKANDYRSAGDALEELGRLQESAAASKPGDVAAKSAYAIAFARAAQARELASDYSRAGPLYQKAARTFGELSAQVPDHAGLRAMAENSARDAQRFNMA